jgi:putative acyl-CoA dehydrogenase
LAHALHHARHRQAFGKTLVEHGLMRNVLADLALESEAAMALALRLARAFDEDSPEARLLRRVLTPAAKFWVCKRGPAAAAEAMEVLGGNGYVEEWPLARIYRQMPLNSIWEGSGNVMCLDVLRAMGRSPESVEAFFGELDQARGGDRRYDAFVDAIRTELTNFDAIETRARRIVERMALAFQASVLIRHGDEAVKSAFCASRLGGDHGYAFGTLPVGVDVERIIERARPKVG